MRREGGQYIWLVERSASVYEDALTEAIDLGRTFRFVRIVSTQTVKTVATVWRSEREIPND